MGKTVTFKLYKHMIYRTSDELLIKKTMFMNQQQLQELFFIKIGLNRKVFLSVSILITVMCMVPRHLSVH